MTAALQPGTRLQRVSARVVERGRAVPGLRRVAMHPLVAMPGYAIATGLGLLWGVILSTGELRRENGMVVASGCPGWAFGRGGTTIGGVYLTRDNVTRGVLEHEAVHRQQWKTYGLAFIPLYLAAGADARRNRFEVEAGLEKGGYA